MKAGSHNHNKQKGFTLVELLLAVTLMSLLLALAYGGLSAATRSSERGQTILEQSGRLRITHQFIRRQLNLMLPLSYASIDEQNEERLMFEGNATFIQFVGPMPGYLGNGGPQVQLIELVDGEEGLQLQLSHALLQDFEQERLNERDPVVLLRGLQDAQFEFLEVDNDGLPLGWVTDWQTPETLPRAVRLQLGLPEQTQVNWPPLIAAARIDPSAVRATGSTPSSYSEAINRMMQGDR